jgi:hypothetical protein
MHRMSNVIYITGERSETALEDALAKAEKGDRIVYHQGQHCGGLHRRAASRAEAEKRCLLFCKRAGPGFFEYIAVKR